MIENCQYQGRESAAVNSDSISLIDAPVAMCVRTILTTFYHMNHYACSYWASGQVFIVKYKVKSTDYACSYWASGQVFIVKYKVKSTVLIDKLVP